MSESSKVIWSEGMFLRPQHFQQHDRYMENMINGRCLGLQPYGWGFCSLTLDRDLLKIGKFALKECAGIFPDGTPFNLPGNDDLPLPLDIPEDTHNQLVFLALPVRRPDAVETDSDANPNGLARFRLREREVGDNNGTMGKAVIQVGGLKTRLLLQRDERSGYTCLGVARIIEARADKNIIVDDRFIPANLDCFSLSTLRGFLRELHGLLNTRGEALAGRMSAAGQGGVAGFADFSLLQLTNRYQLLFEHLSNVVGLHPEEFYRMAVQLAGELATFFRPQKRPAAFSPYVHEDLEATFSPVMEELRELLGKVDEPRAIQIPLSGPRYNIYITRKPDLSLLESAVFVLAANAQVPPETLRTDFPQQVKIAPVEEIRQYVNALMPAISIYPLPVRPEQIPSHGGFVYFELNKHSELWKKMATSGGFAIHIAGNYPGLKLEFWAIKED